VDKGFSCRGGQAVSDFGDVAEMEVGGLDNGADMGIKGKGRVQDSVAVLLTFVSQFPLSSVRLQ
jgi:hypothetical protein